MKKSNVSNSQSLNYTPIFQMFFDDLVNIFFIHVGIPNFFWVDHDHRTFIASIKAARHVDPHLTLAV